MESYLVGEEVEVVRNPQSIEVFGTEPKWVRATIERLGVRFDGKAKVFVRIDGMLVTRQLRYVRRFSS